MIIDEKFAWLMVHNYPCRKFSNSSDMAFMTIKLSLLLYGILNKIKIGLVVFSQLYYQLLLAIHIEL